jgi:hypothetical protein
VSLQKSSTGSVYAVVQYVDESRSGSTSTSSALKTTRKKKKKKAKELRKDLHHKYELRFAVSSRGQPQLHKDQHTTKKESQPPLFLSSALSSFFYISMVPNGKKAAKQRYEPTHKNKTSPNHAVQTRTLSINKNQLK